MSFDFPPAMAVLRGGEVVAHTGPTTTVFPWASVTKLLTTWAILRAGVAGAVSLTDGYFPEDAQRDQATPLAIALGWPAGATLWHLLSHSSGVDFNSAKPLAQVGARRIYSNRGIEIAAAHVAARLDEPFWSWVHRTVLEPLELAGTQLGGSPAAGAHGPATDLAILAREFAYPTLLPPDWARLATQPVFPGLPGMVPGFGRQVDNLWGLGFEIKGSKTPHWTPPEASPATFGHFGRAGSFLWVDPEAKLAAVFLGEQPFSTRHREIWPQIGTTIFCEFGG